jgi:PAS domain S-box-containing protein
METPNSSEELWRSLVQNLPDLVVTADLEGRMTFSNRPIADQTRQQVIGQNFFAFLEPADRDRVESTLRMVVDRSQSISLEARGRLLGLASTWFSIRAAPIHSDGQIKGLILICTDIGMRKALQLDAERFRLLLDHARESILVIDPDDHGRILDVNDRVVKQLGFERGELSSRRFVELVAEPELRGDGKWAAFVAKSTQRTGQVLVGQFLKKDGETLPVELAASLVDVGGHDYLLVTALDLTERKLLEDQLDHERARMHYASKMATLGEMAGGIAHEINNPLTIIEGYAQQLSVWVDQEPFDKLRVKVQAKKISDTVLRIARIVRGLRTFSRDGTLDPVQKTNLRQLVDDTLGLCAEKFRLAEIQLMTPAPADLDLTIDCRATELAQVLLNLLFNARDAVKDLKEKWVKLAVADIGNFVEFSVTDSGGGIDPRIRERMMQPFFTTKDVGQGTGLGLSISRGIVEAHGGRLFYDEQAKHTRFVFILPKLPSILKSA